MSVDTFSVFSLKSVLNHQQPDSDVTGGYITLTTERLRDPNQMWVNHAERGLLTIKQADAQRIACLLDVPEHLLLADLGPEPEILTDDAAGQLPAVTALKQHSAQCA